CPQVLGCDTPNSKPSFPSVQVSERTEGIVGLEIPTDEEQGEVRFVLWCGSLRYAFQRTAWQVDICLVKHVVPKRVMFWPREIRLRHMLQIAEVGSDALVSKKPTPKNFWNNAQRQQRPAHVELCAGPWRASCLVGDVPPPPLSYQAPYVESVTSSSPPSSSLEQSWQYAAAGGI
ncbi:hypothetical protein AB205_0060430, partial [Aquarana catesbeiana]